MLDAFITDVYLQPALRPLAGLLPRRLVDKLRFRHEPRMPDARVKCLWTTTIIERAKLKIGFPPHLVYSAFDAAFSRAAARRARQTNSHLLLYSSYAWEAFTTRYAHTPRKVLFQYHPHPDLERRILLADGKKYDFFRDPYEDLLADRTSDALKRRARDAWRHADLILCASSFTKRSLVEAGADETLCRIVPYGIDLVDVPEAPRAAESFQALFVGTGTQRKGLHHLLLAWQNAKLPRGSGLTAVCRKIEPGLEALALETPNVRLLRRVGANELNELYRASSVFVMPSMVEGFGQVYLEALAQGCPVLGTPATCLPDLGPGGGAIFTVEPGNIAQLTAELEVLSQALPGNDAARRQAQVCAARWPWERFRSSLRAALLAD